MIEVKDIIAIHESLIATYGGSYGIRDNNLLHSIVTGIDQSFDDHELYPTTIEKICRLYYMFVTNQVFVDGNKRTATAVALVLMIKNTIQIPIEFKKDTYKLALTVANKKIGYEDLVRMFDKG